MLGLCRIHAADQRNHARYSEPEDQFDRPDRAERAPRCNRQELHGRADRRRGQNAKGQEVHRGQRSTETAAEARRLVRTDKQPQPHQDMKGGSSREEPKWNGWRQ